jgi:Flp pilus assembly protein TadG
MIVRWLLRPLRDRAGSSALEFALVAPLLISILLGIIQFSLFFNNVSTLNNAAANGALVFSQGRSFSTPYNAAVSAVQGAAGALTKANLTITTSINGVTCATDSACLSAYGSGGMPATVTVSYPCPLVFSTTTLQWIGVDASKICPLSSTMSAVVQ